MRRALGLVDGGFARVATAYGSCVLQVRIDDGQQPGTLFAPIHWSDANASSARVGELVAPRTDPHSGQPDAKATHAAIAPVEFRLRGFALTRQPIALPQDTWWARIAVRGGVGYRFATNLESERLARSPRRRVAGRACRICGRGTWHLSCRRFR